MFARNLQTTLPAVMVSELYVGTSTILPVSQGTLSRHLSPASPRLRRSSHLHTRHIVQPLYDGCRNNAFDSRVASFDSTTHLSVRDLNIVKERYDAISTTLDLIRSCCD